MNLDGKVAVVTGGGTGIGFGIAGVLANRGARLVLAQRHLDRVNAAGAALEPAPVLPLDLYGELDASEMSGDLLSVPVANPPAFWNKTRTGPVDGANLAREFPGSLEKNCTSAIAYSLGESIIAHADFYLDLHSAGIHLNMPRLVGYDARDPRSHRAALAFGSPVLWAHNDSGSGRTVSFASQMGIPYLYTEAQGAGRIHPDDLRFYKQGVLNLLRHLRILPGIADAKPVELHLEGAGDIDHGVRSSARGFLISRVNLLEQVPAGADLGFLSNLRGEPVERYNSPAAGVNRAHSGGTRSRARDMLFHITGVLNRKDANNSPFPEDF